MSQSDASRRAVQSPVDSTGRGDPPVDGEQLLALLSDDYARRVLDALGAEPLPARAVVERVDASRATVYRRLDSLESAGVVESAVSVDADGHHRHRFRLAVERARLSFGPDGVSVEVDPRGEGASALLEGDRAPGRG